MAEVVRESTTVVVVGAGPSGLTLANLLLGAGIGCVVVEARSRAYVEHRQRAGVLDYHATQIFERAGLTERVIQNAKNDPLLEVRIDGEPHFIDILELAGGRGNRILPQQILVQRLITSLLEDGGDLRTEAAGVDLHDIEGERPRVTYTDADGVPHEIECDYIAGCDGFHGVSRKRIPEDALETFAFDHGIGWFTVLAETPPPVHPTMGVSRHGFAAQFPRGPRASRFYLQCLPDDDLQKWPDERIWDQLRVRLGDENLPSGPISEKAVVEMRSFVVDPMSYGRLFLVGDAAHVITPMGGKGMNLALADADILATAIRAAVDDGDDKLLGEYSATCVQRTWRYQEFSRWMTEMLHDSGDDSVSGPFRRKLARARLERLFTSTAVGTTWAEMMAGVG
jgi:p-hydroxybenzoate 3-monooxygenase